MRAPESPHLNLEEEVRAGEKRRDFGAWMRAKEPKGFRGGTKDFRENVTVIREKAGSGNVLPCLLLQQPLCCTF